MSQSRQDILEQVARGEISATKAAALMAEATDEQASTQAPPKKAAAPIPVEEETHAPQPRKQEQSQPSAKTSGHRWLRIHVSDLNSGKSRVRVNIPLRLVKIGAKLGRGFVPELEDLDWDDIANSLAEGEDGLLVDVADESSGEHVQIYVE